MSVKRWLVAVVVMMSVGLSVVLAKSKPEPEKPARKAPATQGANPKKTGVHKPASPAPSPDTAPLVAWIEIAGELTDAPPALAWVDPDHGKPTLRKIIKALHRVAGENRFIGATIYLDQPELTLAQVDEIEQAIRAVRAAKKKVIVFAEAYDLHGYLLACAADQILLQRKGQLELTGLGMEEMYLAGLLEKIGVKADYLQVGKFKGADEQLTRVGPSPEWSQNIDGLLDDLWTSVVARVGKARKLDSAQVEKAFADVWAMSDAQYVQRKLIDGLTDRDISDASVALYGDDFEWEDMLAKSDQAGAADNPMAMLQLLMQPPKPGPRRASLAIIHGSGAIHSGDSGRPGGSAGLFGGDSIGSKTLCDALAEARDDDMIKGVVLRLDSPGGSALASEVIWQSVREVAQAKPVYVSISGMAASGGYYIASAGQQIYVAPDSIVGSIGVVGGKITLGGLYEKLGITIHRRSRGPMGDMFNSVEPFTPEQRAALKVAFEHTYEQFVDRVTIGRGKRIKDIGAVAEGRIFLGARAVELGLADRVGGLDDALADLAKSLKLAPGAYDIINLPPPMSLPEFLEGMFDTFVSAEAPIDRAATLTAARTVLGRSGWRAVRPTLQGMMLLEREKTLLLMPAALRIR